MLYIFIYMTHWIEFHSYQSYYPEQTEIWPKEFQRVTMNQMFDNLIKDNQKSIFLCGIDEIEVIEIVRKLKNKKSTHINSIDMVIIKEVLDFIVKPLPYICNLSF